MFYRQKRGLFLKNFYDMNTACYYMRLALLEARKTVSEGASDIPVGCVIADSSGNIIAAGHNTRELSGSVTAHAEINALEAARLHTRGYKLQGAVMFVTLEPCPMCAGAIAAARLKAVFYGASNKSNGACGTVFNLLYPQLEVFGGICAEESAVLLQTFFKKLRGQKQ